MSTLAAHPQLDQGDLISYFFPSLSLPILLLPSFLPVSLPLSFLLFCSFLSYDIFLSYTFVPFNLFLLIY